MKIAKTVLQLSISLLFAGTASAQTAAFLPVMDFLKEAQGLKLPSQVGIPAVAAEPDVQTMRRIGPYVLGTRYEVYKDIPGFTLDPLRSDPEADIVAAKFINENIVNTPTIQRLIFKHGILIRVSIIFHPPDVWNEEAVKAWLVRQWGDPGPKKKVGDDMRYSWAFEDTYGMILPADGGRFMASLSFATY